MLTNWRRIASQPDDLLNVLGLLVELEPQQGGLLKRICKGRLISAKELKDAGALDLPATHKARRPSPRQPSLLDGLE